MKIKCLYDKLVPISELKKLFHPKNRNNHPPDQIERLAKILAYQGARYPAKISNLSNKISSGHGRVLAAEKAGWDVYPVNYQDYDDEAQEIADLNSDNAIAAWSEIDLAGVNFDVQDLGPDFDVELLGFKEFSIEPAEKFEMDDELKEDMNKKFILEISFPNDMEMMDIHDDLVSRGYIVKVRDK
jgi:hypothetical protein